LFIVLTSVGSRPTLVPLRPPIHIAPVVSIHVPPTESAHQPPALLSATSPPDVVVVVRDVVVVTTGGCVAHAMATAVVPIASH
jgi:hypothetical protein